MKLTREQQKLLFQQVHCTKYIANEMTVSSLLRPSIAVMVASGLYLWSASRNTSDLQTASSSGI